MASLSEPELEPGQLIQLDPKVKEHLPPNAVYTCTHHQRTLWHQLAKIEVTAEPDGKDLGSYFLKTSTGIAGYNLLMADYESMVALEDVIPSNSFRFKARGWLAASEERTYFLLFDYKKLAEPEDMFPVRLGQAIAKLHKDSRASDLYPPRNPTLGGRFGFHRQTSCHTFRQHREWSLVWHEFFAKHTEKLLEFELSMWGGQTSAELEQLSVGLVERVIPRLLRPLETDGRTIEPVLIHGNLDWGGFSTEMGGGNHGSAILFNGGVLWAHNEYDLGPMIAISNHKATEEVKTFVTRALTTYHRLIPKAEPVKEWEARLRLYSLRTFIHNSALHAQNQAMRDLMIAQIKILVDKFGGDDSGDGSSDGSTGSSSADSFSECSGHSPT